MDCNGGFVRGAYLANIEIEHRCRLRGTKHDDNFVEALLTYFYRFVFLSNWIWHLAILVTSSTLNCILLEIISFAYSFPKFVFVKNTSKQIHAS